MMRAILANPGAAAVLQAIQQQSSAGRMTAAQQQALAQLLAQVLFFSYK